MVFARARPPLERESGEHEVVRMDSSARKTTVRVEEGDSLERALQGELGAGSDLIGGARQAGRGPWPWASGSAPLPVALALEQLGVCVGGGGGW